MALRSKSDTESFSKRFFFNVGSACRELSLLVDVG